MMGREREGGMDAGFLHSLCSTASLWNLDPPSVFFVHSKCKFMSSSFFFPSSPLPKYRRPSRRTDGWMDGGRALNEDGDEEARLACPAPPPRSSLPPSLRPNVRPSLCPNLECQNADPSTALGPSLWTRARSTTDPFHLTYAWQLVRRFSNFHTPLPTLSRLFRQMRPTMFRE